MVPFALSFEIASATVTEKDSAEFEVSQSAAQIHDGVDFINDWVVDGGGLEGAVDGPQVTMTVTENNGWIHLDNDSTAWEVGVEDEESWTVEVRARLADDAGNGFVIWAANGVERGILQVNTGDTQIFGGEVLNESDNTDAFHDFRMAFDSEEALYFFWRDGELLNPEGSPAQAVTGNNRLIVGDCCGTIETTSFDVEHIRFDTTGAFSPVVDLSDTDGDGIPNTYEDENGLDPNVNDAGEDKDGDGLTNLQEFNLGLLANNADTDGDTLSDGQEVNETETNPNSADTDGDLLNDNVETNTGIFVSASNTGTDPQESDTDGDGVNDGVEVGQGSDPNDAASKPESSLPQKNATSFELIELANQIYDGEDLQGDWVNAGGFTDFELDGPVLTLDSADNNGWLEHDNDSTAWEVGVEDGGSWTAEIRLRLAADEGNGIVLWAANGSERGILQINDASTDNFGAEILDENDNTDAFHTFRMAFDSDDGLYYFWRDGVLLNPDGALAQGGTGNNRFIVGDCCSSLFMTSVDLEYISYDTTGAFSPVIDEGDSDGDGMPDFYEDENDLDSSVNDAELDKDSDGLTNLEEFNAGLPANDPDADDDGLLDGVETGTGTWVSATNTGTQAKSADSDADGLSDGVESNSGAFVGAADTGSDPNKKDTDGDGFEDGKEVERGSNPVDASSVPPPSVQPKDSAAFEFTASAGEIFDGEDFGGDWVNAGGSTDFELDGSVLTLTSADNNGWLEHDNGDTPWETGVAEGGSWTAEIRVRLAEDDNNGIVIWGANGSERAVILIETDGVSVLNGDFLNDEDNTDGFHDFRVAYDAEDETYLVWRDGESLTPDEGLPAQAATGNNRFIVGDCCSTVEMTSVDLEYIRYDTTGAWSPGSGAPPVISSLQVAAGNAQVTLTWDSTPGSSYIVESSENLQTWVEIEDGLESGGDSTSLTFNGPGEAVRKNYYRIKSE